MGRFQCGGRFIEASDTAFTLPVTDCSLLNGTAKEKGSIFDQMLNRTRGQEVKSMKLSFNCDFGNVCDEYNVINVRKLQSFIGLRCLTLDFSNCNSKQSGLA